MEVRIHASTYLPELNNAHTCEDVLLAWSHDENDLGETPIAIWWFWHSRSMRMNNKKKKRKINTVYTYMYKYMCVCATQKKKIHIYIYIYIYLFINTYIHRWLHILVMHVWTQTDSDSSRPTNFSGQQTAVVRIKHLWCQKDLGLTKSRTNRRQADKPNFIHIGTKDMLLVKLRLLKL